MAVVRDYLLPVAVGLVVGLVIFLGIVGYRYHRQRRVQQGFIRLSQARTVADLEDIGRYYRGTPAAFVALLGAAADYYHRDQFDAALQKYSELSRQFSDHPLAPLGTLGRAYCLEGRGQPEQGRKIFLSLSTNSAAPFLQDVARIGAARCLEEMKRSEEAADEYQRFLDERPESPWAPLARTALLYVKQDLRVAPAAAQAMPWALPVQRDSEPESLSVPLPSPGEDSPVAPPSAE